MEELTQRTQEVIESLTGNEALTDNLDDAAAQALLDWGIAYGQRIVQNTANLTSSAAEEAMAQPLQATQRLMRAINQYYAPATGPENNASTRNAQEALVTLLHKVMEQTAIIAGAQFIQPDEQKLADFATQLTQTAPTPLALITALHTFIDQQQVTTADPPPQAQPPQPPPSPPVTAQAAVVSTGWLHRFFTQLRRFYPQAKQID